MAHVDWSAGIDSVSGALSKPSKKGRHSCNKMLLGTHRVAPTTSNECTRLYLRKKTVRVAPVTAEEREVRNRFSAISKAVAQRKQDLSKVAQDLAAFNAQKNQPGGYTTLKQYLWHVAAEELNG